MICHYRSYRTLPQASILLVTRSVWDYTAEINWNADQIGRVFISPSAHLYSELLFKFNTNIDSDQKKKRRILSYLFNSHMRSRVLHRICLKAQTGSEQWHSYTSPLHKPRVYLFNFNKLNFQVALRNQNRSNRDVLPATFSWNTLHWPILAKLCIDTWIQTMPYFPYSGLHRTKHREREMFRSRPNNSTSHVDGL
jgi:hypothetical protein